MVLLKNMNLKMVDQDMKPLRTIIHDHLIDIESGEIHEFTNEEIEEIQRSVAKSLGYRLVDHRLELYGIKIKKDN